MAQRNVELEIRKPFPDRWGTHGYSESGLAYQASALSELLGPMASLHTFPGAEKLDAAGLRRVLRENFKRHKAASDAEAPQLVSEAMSALRVLLEQLYLDRCSSSCTTEGVRIDATSKFTTSDADYSGRTHNIFSYCIRVTNQRNESIQVLAREWTIKNDRGQITAYIPHVPDNGVVGQRPVIPPGCCWEYVSGTDLDTPSGLQDGKLEIAVLERGQTMSRFMAAIKPFLHLRPDTLKE